MINYLDQENRAERFNQYLNMLAYNHYTVLYPSRRTSPLDDAFYEANGILGTLLFACACKFPYPEREIMQYSAEARSKLPPAEEIYKEWIGLTLEKVVVCYCDAIDDVALQAAMDKNPGGFFISCPLYARRKEIIEKLFAEIRKVLPPAPQKEPINSNKTKKKKI